MSMETMYLGEVPTEEACAQVGTEGYMEQARKECTAYIHQIRRELGNEPQGALLRIQRNQHDFGTYLSVECLYEVDREEAIEYAYKCESEGPERWDQDAKKELGIKDAVE